LSFYREGNVFGQSLRDHPNICFHFTIYQPTTNLCCSFSLSLLCNLLFLPRLKTRNPARKKHPFSKGNLCSLFSADRFYLSLAKIEQNPSQEHNKILTLFLLLAAAAAATLII
jgi:hypothetical protein